MDRLKEQILAVWGDMSPTRRWTTAGLLAAVVVGFGVLIASQTTVKWAPLGRGLTPEDLDHAVQALEEKRIPVRMREDEIIEVPEDKLHEARLAVAAKGSAGGGVGMELFNESNFGQSAFQEKVNYHRALEGELARTIRSLDVVTTARVHLVIPKKALFRKNQKKPTASVKVQVRPGVELTKAQIRGMRNLVASAIEGLSPQRVTIIDQRGDMLAGPEDAHSLNEDFLEIQAAREGQLEDAVVQVLRPVVEGGKVRVQVTADMDFSREEITEKQLDPDKQVATSENRIEETSSAREQKPKGVAGVAGNMPGQGVPEPVNQEDKSSKRESTQYETASTTRRTERPAGALKRLTVAVVVGGTGEGDEWKGLSPEETKQLEQLAANAVGLDRERGDTITVISRKFTEEAQGTAAVASEPLAPWIRELIKWGVLLVLAGIFVFGVVRPFVKLAKPEPEAAPVVEPEEPSAIEDENPETAIQLAEGVVDGVETPEEEPVEGEAENPAIGELPEHEESEPMDEIIENDSNQDESEKRTYRGERLRVRAIEATHEDPERAVQIIRTWLLVEDLST